MAVVKNMIVRVGADVSGLVSGFKQGGSSTKAFAKAAAEEIKSLGQEIQKMESAYAKISQATARMNLGTSVSKQIAALTKERDKLMAKSDELAQKANYWAEIEPIGKQFKTDEAVRELETVNLKLHEMETQLRELQSVSDLGKELGLSDVSTKSLQQMQNDIREAKLQMVKLSASASGSSVNVEKLLGSIKRLGIASLGLRFVRAIFGGLSSIVRQYISENDALQAQVNALKSAFGQALAPAINIVTNALSALMPYILGISNAIGTLLQALGGGWATVAAEANGATKAIKGAGGAQADLNRSLQGFDEITKLSGKSSGGGGGGAGGTGPTVQVEPITPTWVQEFIDRLVIEIQEQDWAGVGTVVVQGLSGGIGAAGGLVAKVSVQLFNPIEESFSKYVDKYVKEGAPNMGTAIALGVIEGICTPFVNAPEWIRENIWIPMTHAFNTVFYGQEIADVKLGLKDDTATWKQKVRAWWNSNPPKDLPIAATMQDDSTIWWKVVRDSWKKKKDANGGKVESFTTDVKDDSTSWWKKVKGWFKTTKDNDGGKVDSFETDVKDDSTEWWQNAKAWWIKSKGVLDINATIPNEASSWWSMVQSYWSKHSGVLKTRLEIETPKVSVVWDKSTGPNNANTYVPNYVVKWNAAGAILDGAQLFGMVGNTLLGGGEAGREAVLPLDRNTEWMDGLADKVAARVGGGSADRNITVNLVLDGKVITSTVVRNVNAQARATGVHPMAAYI